MSSIWRQGRLLETVVFIPSPTLRMGDVITLNHSNGTYTIVDKEGEHCGFGEFVTVLEGSSHDQTPADRH